MNLYNDLYVKCKDQDNKRYLSITFEDDIPSYVLSVFIKEGFRLQPSIMNLRIMTIHPVIIMPSASRGGAIRSSHETRVSWDDQDNPHDPTDESKK
jgi:hypothetical protein